MSLWDRGGPRGRSPWASSSSSSAVQPGVMLALAVGTIALLLSMAEISTQYTAERWIRRDGRFYINVNTTLVEGLSLDQGEFCASWYERDLGWNRTLTADWSNVAEGADGRRLPKHPILMPVLSTPLFWAFGLRGALIFHLGMLMLAAASAVVIGQHYGSRAAAATAALALIFATGIRQYVYDYHVDVLMLALFSAGLALVHQKRGFRAGILIGMTVALRPTALLWLPSLMMIAGSEADRKTLVRSLLGGMIPIALYAASNAYLYGAPWWTGYNRVIIRAAGETLMADHNDAFSIPFKRGFDTLFEGPTGIKTRLALMVASVPGLLVLLRKHFWTALAAAIGTAASVFLFSKYQWTADRFIWPSCVLLIPALTTTFDLFGKILRRFLHHRAALASAVACAAIVAAAAAAGGPLERRAPGFDAQTLVMHLGIVSAFGFGWTRVAERVVKRELAALLPVTVLLLPGVANTAADGGPDLVIAATMGLALSARGAAVSLGFAIASGYLMTRSELHEDPATLFAELTELRNWPRVFLLASTWLSIGLLGRQVFLLTPLLLLAIPEVAGLGGGRWPLFMLTLTVLSVPVVLGALLRGVRTMYRALPRPRVAILTVTVLGALALAGAARRIEEPRFRIATPEAVRSALVTTDNIPCDMLTWEHMTWECANVDRGVHGQTGLSTSRPLHVNGREAGLFLLVVGPGHHERVVRWTAVDATDRFLLRYTVADELAGGGTLFVAIDGEDVFETELPLSNDATVHEQRIDTRRFAGRTVSLEVRLRGRGTALIDGEFELPSETPRANAGPRPIDR